MIAMIEGSPLNETIKTQYKSAIDDFRLCSCGELHDTLDGIFAWPALLLSGFADDFVERRPEALVILAHYAVLIHWHQNSWLFLLGGRRLIHAINHHL